MLNHFKLVKHLLQNNNECKMNKIHKTDHISEAVHFAPKTFLKSNLPSMKGRKGYFLFHI